MLLTSISLRVERRIIKFVKIIAARSLHGLNRF